jgi:Arc/MetJ-type ribon-helix-helix transcriptional regulator
MNLEIHKPELERRVREGIQSGRFHDADELISKALDALFEKEASGTPPNASPNQKATGTIFEQGLGLFGSAEDAALLDEVVSIAYDERRRPTKPLLAF